MRIVFVGVVDFSYHCLEQILSRGGQVSAVLTLPKGKAEFHSDYADLAPLARAHGIPLHYITHINNPETLDLLRSLAPEVIMVLGWSQIVGSEVLCLPPNGCVGAHPALLPRNRGRHPIIWALVEGLKESGLTFFYMDNGADSGDILWQRPFPITMDDDASSLYAKVKQLATEAIGEFLPQLEAGVAPRTPQDPSCATYWRKRTEDDGEIHWEASSITTYNLVRALTRPYMGAHTFLNGNRVVVWKAKLPYRTLAPDLLAQPSGTILESGSDGLCVRTGDAYLTISEHELSEKMLMKIGERFGKNS
jgi:methionyl-tRNA formyltransferase